MEKVTYTNSKGQSIELNSLGPFYLSSITGTGTNKITITTSKGPGQDGVTVDDTLLEEKSPAIEGAIIGISLEDAYKKRRQLCNVFNPKYVGTLEYENDAGTYKIDCIPQDSPTFKNTDSVAQEFQIQLFAPDPFWKDTQESKSEIAEWLGGFSFPLEILADGIQMGHRQSSTIINVFNPGDVPCGLRVVFTALATVVNPSIMNVNTHEQIKIKKSMIQGDIITVYTGYGNNKAEYTAKGNTEFTNALGLIDLLNTTLPFMKLNPGDNLIKYNADTNVDNLECSIYYLPQYMGV